MYPGLPQPIPLFFFDEEQLAMVVVVDVDDDGDGDVIGTPDSETTLILSNVSIPFSQTTSLNPQFFDTLILDTI